MFWKLQKFPERENGLCINFWKVANFPKVEPDTIKLTDPSVYDIFWHPEHREKAFFGIFKPLFSPKGPLPLFLF